MKLIKDVEITIDLTAEQLAEYFWLMDSNNQARFFNWLGQVDLVDLGNQMNALVDSDRLNHGGKAVLAKIAHRCAGW